MCFSSLRRSGRRRTHDAERGAAATVVALLLAGGVIMGMLAVSVDIGNLTYERRQLQNAADATSMALASECAADETNCDPENADVKDLLGANSHDAVSRYSPTPYAKGACAHGPGLPVGSVLAPCAPPTDLGDLLQCPPIPTGLDPAIPYVETYAATRTIGNGDKLFLPFSRVLAGGDPSGDAGSSACARAAWGKPVGYSASLPLTFSSCEWEEQTAGGTDYVENGPIGAKPGYGSGNPWPSADKEVVLWLNAPSSEDTHCSWNGKDTAGGFGWLDADGDCEAEVSADDWVQIDPGVNVENDCKTKLAGLLHTVIEVPIFDCIVGDEALAVGEPPTAPAGVCNPANKNSSGANTWYHLAGWAKFYVSGYVLPGHNETGMSLGAECGSGDKCITGWFLTGALSDAADIAPPGGDGDFGTYVVKPVG